MISMWRCCFSTLLWLAALRHSGADYPQVNMNGETLSWTEAEHNRGAWHRINDTSACRDRPPMHKNILYMLSYRFQQECKFYVADPLLNDEYEPKIDKNDFVYDKCEPYQLTHQTEPDCALNIASPNYIVTYCGSSMGYNARKIYLMELSRGPDQRYKLTVVSWSPDNNRRPSKVSISRVRHRVNWDNFLFSDAMHIKFSHVRLKPKPELILEKWKPIQYLEANFPGINRQKLWTYCRVFKQDGEFCELNFDTAREPFTRTIQGAFNQYECLRIRRGIVRYSASTDDLAGIDGNFGYVVENFEMRAGAPQRIFSQQCYFSPNLPMNHRLVNMHPIWMGDEAKLKEICERGLPTVYPPAQLSQRYGTAQCGTALFPATAKGAFRIVGMEPNNIQQPGIFGLPRLAVYNGVDADPEFLGDPEDLLRFNCYTQENGNPTGLAHFGIRVLDDSNFVVFCNRAYGVRLNFTDEQRKKGSTLFLFEYSPPTAGGPAKFRSLAQSHLQVATGDSYLRFLDNRGVLMIPKGDGKLFYFVQMKPCAVFKLDRSNPTAPGFHVKPPNQQPDYVCKETDLADVITGMGIDYAKLALCAQRNGILVPGTEFEPSVYVTQDLLTATTKIPMGKVGCVETNYHLINENGSQHVYTFDPENTFMDPTQPCFKPPPHSSSFQMILLNSALCQNTWVSPVPPVTVPTTSAAPTTTTTTQPAAPGGGGTSGGGGGGGSSGGGGGSSGGGTSGGGGGSSDGSGGTSGGGGESSGGGGTSGGGGGGSAGGGGGGTSGGGGGGSSGSGSSSTSPHSEPWTACENRFVDTIEGVIAAGVSLALCLCLLVSAVEGVSVGRRRSNDGNPPPNKKKGRRHHHSQTTDTETSTSVSQSNLPTPNAKPSPQKKKGTVWNTTDNQSDYEPIPALNPAAFAQNNQLFHFPSTTEPDNVYVNMADVSAVRKPNDPVGYPYQ